MLSTFVYPSLASSSSPLVYPWLPTAPVACCDPGAAPTHLPVASVVPTFSCQPAPACSSHVASVASVGSCGLCVPTAGLP